MSAPRFLGVLLVSTIGLPILADPPVLSSPRRSGPEYSFTLQGEFNGSYVIEHSTNLLDWLRVSTNREPAAVRSITYMDWWHRTHFLRAYRLREALFTHAILARDPVDLRYVRGVTVDSFDSADSLYSTDGRYDPAKAKDNGDLSGSGSFIGNARIKGSISTFFGGEVTVGPNGSVGSKAWVDGGNLGIQPGHIKSDAEWHPILVAPPFTNAPPPESGTVGGLPYAYLLGSGNYLLPSLHITITNAMRVTGDAVLFVQGNIFISQGAIEIDQGATLILYAGGFGSSIDCSSISNPGNATNFQYYGLPGNERVWFGGAPLGEANSFTGTIYAPHADMLIDAKGGQISLSFDGSIVARRVVVYGPCDFHFDENLRRNGPQR